MLAEVFRASTLLIQVHYDFSKDFYLFGGQIPQFRLHFLITTPRILVRADTPKTGIFSRFTSFVVRLRSPMALLGFKMGFQLYRSIRIDFADFVARKSYLN